MSFALSVLRTVAAFVVAVLLVPANPTNAYATDVIKTYDFGPGTSLRGPIGSSTSTFSIPCGTPGAILVSVKFKRLGPVDQIHSFSLDFEIREPVVGTEAQGRIAQGGAFGGTVHTTERTVTVSVAPTAGGCSRPWSVKVKSRDGDPPFVVMGDIRLRYAGETRDLSVPTMSNQYLNKGQSRILLIDSSAGCGQGRMVITGIWNHTIGIVPGPMPIALKFEILNDAFTWSGTAVANASGYSNNEARSDLTKLRLVHQIPECRVGQWKLKITNVSDHDAFISSISAKMTPTCP